MKTFFSLFTIALLVGCTRSPAPVSQMDKFRAEAASTLPAAVSNYVVGITRIVHTDLQCYSESVSNWNATATVEFVNQRGGIERKDYPFVFLVVERDGGEHIYCMANTQRIYSESISAAFQPH